MPASGAAPDDDLRELRHRNDNALQLVASLLRLRLARLPSATAAALAPAVGQIDALVLAQAHLNRRQGIGRIGLRRPLEELCAAQEARGVQAGGGVRVLLDAHEVEVEPDRLVPLILFAQEAIGNAQRHAFPKGAGGPGEAVGGKVRVRLRPTGAAIGATGLVLEIADDGIGLPPGSAFLRTGPRAGSGRGRRGHRRRGEGLGGQLIEGFVRQLGGGITVTSAPGLKLTLTID